MTDAPSLSGRSTRSGRELPWWLWTVVGTLSIVCGVIVLTRPADSLTTLAVVVGIFMLAESLFELATALDRHGEDRGTSGLIAVLGLVAGILLVRHPITGVTGIALLIGIWLVAVGAVRFAATVVLYRSSALLLAAVQVIAGIVIVASPGIGFATLAVLVGLSFIVNGMALIGLGWTLHLVHVAEGGTPVRAVPS